MNKLLFAFFFLFSTNAFSFNIYVNVICIKNTVYEIKKDGLKKVYEYNKENLFLPTPKSCINNNVSKTIKM